MDTATKTGIDAEKTASKKIVQKTAEATRDLIANKIIDQITWIGKSKEKKQTNKPLYSIIKKGNKLLMILNCFE